MNKITRIILILVLLSAGSTYLEKAKAADLQPTGNDSKLLEYSLNLFSKKIVDHNKVINMQYKRYGRKAVLSFDMIKPNEIWFMLYLLEYNDGDWRISKEYHYSKIIVAPASARIC